MDYLDFLAEFFTLSTKLKSTIRYSSCPKEIQESTAGHCWHISFMVPVIVNELKLDINIQHAMEIATVHDLPEYVLSEDFDSFLVFTGVLNKTDKEKSEEAVMVDLSNKFNFGPKLYALWKEYEECKTPEAKFIKALDKIESHFHFIEHGSKLNDLDNLRYQICYADNAVRNFPELEPFLKTVKRKLRVLMESQGIVWKDEYNYPD